MPVGEIDDRHQQGKRIVIRIFLNYRREDSDGHAGRLSDRLSQHFGHNSLFMDVDTIGLGRDFVVAIQDAVGTCDVLLAVIGRQWLNSADPLGRQRLDDPEDFVRLEIMTALIRNIRVIPVLVGGASMPHSTALPDVLQPLARRHALVIGDHFHSDVDRLIAVLEETSDATLSSIASSPEPHTILEPSFINSIGMEFVLIPNGTFMMGAHDSDADADKDEKPAHRVTISRPFYLGKYPVTQAQWEEVMGTNPSWFCGYPNQPVEFVSWDNAFAFLRKLNEREWGSAYRLPTEAEWEHACRAGTETPRYHHDIEAIAWYRTNSNGQTHPVGQKLPNAWGLYDMLGNVREWCHDGARPYKMDAVVDPIGPTGAGALRVFRGGSWHDTTQLVRAAYRRIFISVDQVDSLGFRCACSGRRR